MVAIHYSGQTTCNAGQEIDEVAGGTSGMGVDREGEVGDRASEGQATQLYGTGFTVGSLARMGCRDQRLRLVLTRS